MVDRITSSLAREAILAALKDQAGAADQIREDARRMFEAAVDTGAAGTSAESKTPGTGLSGNPLGEGVMAVDRELKSVQPDKLASELVTGEIEGIHQVAAKIQRAKITFEYAMEVRNKLIEAYRETMRMGI